MHARVLCVCVCVCVCVHVSVREQNSLDPLLLYKESKIISLYHVRSWGTSTLIYCPAAIV
jgi:hypothetical protein